MAAPREVWQSLYDHARNSRDVAKWESELHMKVYCFAPLDQIQPLYRANPEHFSAVVACTAVFRGQRNVLKFLIKEYKTRCTERQWTEFVEIVHRLLQDKNFVGCPKLQHTSSTSLTTFLRVFPTELITCKIFLGGELSALEVAFTLPISKTLKMAAKKIMEFPNNKFTLSDKFPSCRWDSNHMDALAVVLTRVHSLECEWRRWNLQCIKEFVRLLLCTSAVTDLDWSNWFVMDSRFIQNHLASLPEEELFTCPIEKVALSTGLHQHDPTCPSPIYPMLLYMRRLKNLKISAFTGSAVDWPTLLEVVELGRLEALAIHVDHAESSFVHSVIPILDAATESATLKTMKMVLGKPEVPDARDDEEDEEEDEEEEEDEDEDEEDSSNCEASVEISAWFHHILKNGNMTLTNVAIHPTPADSVVHSNNIKFFCHLNRMGRSQVGTCTIDKLVNLLSSVGPADDSPGSQEDGFPGMGDFDDNLQTSVLFGLLIECLAWIPKYDTTTQVESKHTATTTTTGKKRKRSN